MDASRLLLLYPDRPAVFLELIIANTIQLGGTTAKGAGKWAKGRK